MGGVIILVDCKGLAKYVPYNKVSLYRGSIDCMVYYNWGKENSLSSEDFFIRRFALSISVP